VKVLYEGTNSLTNLQKMQADKAAPEDFGRHMTIP